MRRKIRAIAVSTVFVTVFPFRQDMKIELAAAAFSFVRRDVETSDSI